jgi:hypothetical protein
MNLSYAQWTQTTTRLGIQGSTTRTVCWIRMDPPAWAWRTELGAGWSHDVIDERGHLHTDSQRENCLLYASTLPFTMDNLIRKVVAPEPPTGPVFEDTLDTLVVRPVFLKLRRVLRYEWEVIRNNFRIRYQVWAEPKSRRLVRKEKREFNLLSGQEFSHEVFERYIYNRKPPPGTFDMPPGRLIEQVSGDNTRREVWNTLAEE